MKTLDAKIFTLLVGGYGLIAALRFADFLASGVALTLAAISIALYLKATRDRTRQMLVFAAIAAIAIAPTVLGIYLRQVSAPHLFVHDGVIQTEEAVKFLLAGKNPYAENYLDTPLAMWTFTEGNLTENPALYHSAYLPFLFLFSMPFYLLFQATVGWFDERVIYLTLFLAAVFLVRRLARTPGRQRALMLAISLNPLFVPFLIEGRNDVFVLFWLGLSLVSLHADRPYGSAIYFALACASKQTAWFLAPFYFLYSSRAHSFSKLARQFFLCAAVFIAIVLPFVLWDPNAFIDDLFRYTAGTTAHSYPIKSIGFGGLALALGWIPNNAAYFPFDLLQLAFGLPTFVLLLLYQRARNSASRMWIAYAAMTVVIAFFSRVFNDNHLGYVLSLFALGALSDRSEI